MTMQGVVLHDPRSVPLPQRLAAHAAVGAARLLATRSPRRIRGVLGLVRRGARPAGCVETKEARDAVVAVSLACGGPEGCLVRSLATALLCRLHGRWPVWCLGVRYTAPFGAHAWVEAGGEAVGEDFPPGYFRTLFTVP
ncbi:lasso peptide biosynthesis B2 protein [Streptomyces sp. NPDC053367]|uniref:lasso peptide biosynthesis B2 protein n=1 Tax=Streptomyces sp. NPDC053367 TaxID=3365700 RepID=UPI0037D7437B